MVWSQAHVFLGQLARTSQLFTLSHVLALLHSLQVDYLAVLAPRALLPGMDAAESFEADPHEAPHHPPVLKRGTGGKYGGEQVAPLFLSSPVVLITLLAVGLRTALQFYQCCGLIEQQGSCSPRHVCCPARLAAW